MSVLSGLINIEPNVEDTNDVANVEQNADTMTLQVDVEETTNVVDSEVQHVQQVRQNIIVLDLLKQ
jgi:hypothetical protein